MAQAAGTNHRRRTERDEIMKEGKGKEMITSTINRQCSDLSHKLNEKGTMLHGVHDVARRMVTFILLHLFGTC